MSAIDSQVKRPVHVEPHQIVQLSVHAVRMALDHCLGRGAYDPRLAHQLYLHLTRKPK